MHRGYVKFWRKILDWEWFSCSETFHLFAYLFLAANHSDGNYKGIEVKRGQLLTGRKSISEKTGISQRSVRTSLKRLKSTGEITVKTTNKFSIITLCNYEIYNPYDSKNDQQNDQQTDQQVTSKRPANDQQVTTNKNYKNDKNEKNDKNIPLEIPEHLKEVWVDFLEMRKKIRKPATERAQKNILTKLYKLSNDMETQIKIIDQSITNSWQDIYELKSNIKKQYGRQEYTPEDFKRQMEKLSNYE